MPPGRSRKLVALAALLVTLVVLAVVAQRIAVRQLRAGIEAALGPRASVGAIAIGLTGVELRELRIRSARGAWPAEDELRAQRVHLRPALATLWSPGWHIASVRIDAGYVSLQRTRDGRLRLLPALLEKAPAAAPGGARSQVPVHVRRIVLADATVDFYDASVRQPAHRLQFDQLAAQIGPIAWPALDAAAQIDLSARLRGPQRHGQLAVAGEVTPATRDGRLKADVRGVDLVALQPYLLRVNEGGVRRGTLDLALDARVQAQRLHAPGRLTLAGLELAPGGGVLATFAGVPRQAIVAAMSRDGRIEVAFTLEGRIDDPAFSLNENFATKLAGGLAEVLGVSLGGVVEGMNNVIKGLFGR